VHRVNVPIDGHHSLVCRFAEVEPGASPVSYSLSFPAVLHREDDEELQPIDVSVEKLPMHPPALVINCGGADMRCWARPGTSELPFGLMRFTCNSAP
jgi:hypothetical protein